MFSVSLSVPTADDQQGTSRRHGAEPAVQQDHRSTVGRIGCKSSWRPASLLRGAEATEAGRHRSTPDRQTVSVIGEQCAIAHHLTMD
jgi:ribosomal protein L3